MGDAESPVSLEEVLRETSFEPAPVRSRCSAWQALWLAPLAGWAVAVWQIADTDRPVPAAPFALIAVGTTATTGWLTALNHPCEFVATLGYRGTLCLYAGALITLTCRVALGEPDASGGALFGLLLVGSGLVMWACATFVQGPIPYMRGASLLVIGVQLRIGTAAAALSDAGVDRTSLAVCEAVAVACWLPGIASLLAKAYEEMRPPWLSAPNHNFGAFLIFGLGLACDAAIGLSYFCDDPVDLRGLDGAGGSAVLLAAAVLTLRMARIDKNVDALLEERYPLTSHLIAEPRAFAAAFAAGWALLLSSALSAILLSLADRGVPADAPLEGSRQRGIFGSHAAALFVGSAAYGLLAAAVRLSPRPPFGSVCQLVAFLLLAAGCAVEAAAVAARVGAGGGASERMLDAAGYAATGGAGGSVAGALLLAVLGQRRHAAGQRVGLDPRTWLRATHPSNYVLLAAAHTAVGAALRVAGMNAGGGVVALQGVGSALCAVAAAVWLMFFSAAMAVYETTSLPARSLPLLDFGAPPPPSGEEGEEAAAAGGSDEGLPLLEVDVLVCGGSISGLSVASLLGRAGVRTLLVERREEPVTDARFLFCNPATMDILSKVLDPDLLEELRVQRAWPQHAPFGTILATGLAHEDGSARCRGSALGPSPASLKADPSRMNAITESRCVGCASSRFVHPTRCMQSHQEQVLKAQAERCASNEVRYGHELLSLAHEGVEEEEQSGTCILALLRPTGGAPETRYRVRCKYVVGADGPASRVAELVGAKYDGFLGLNKSRSIAVVVPGLAARLARTIGFAHQYWLLRKRRGLGLVVPVDPVSDLFNLMPFPVGELFQQSPARVAEEMTGTSRFTLKQEKPWWWNFFVARQFSHGRAFLVGDCAHSWPPFGGLGGNTAYADAFNLSWKLAAACRGEASQALLNSYDIERRQAVLSTAMYVLGLVPRPAAMKPLLAPVFEWWPFSRWMRLIWHHKSSGLHAANHFASSGIMFGGKLNFSPLVAREAILPPDDPACGYQPVLRAGARLPHLLLPDGTAIAEHIANDRYTLLLLADASATAEALRAALQARGVACQVARVAAHAKGQETSGGQLAFEYAKHAMLVVRPDLHVAWRLKLSARPPDAAAVESVADTLSGRSGGGTDRWAEVERSTDYDSMRSYRLFMTQRFQAKLRPLGFAFPQATKVDGVTKAEAIAAVKANARTAPAAKGEFTTTTKATDLPAGGKEPAAATGSERTGGEGSKEP